jgi:hypothetical protein
METEQPTSTTQSNAQPSATFANTQPQSQAQVYGPQGQPAQSITPFGTMAEMPRVGDFRDPYDIIWSNRNRNRELLESGKQDNDKTFPVREDKVWSSAVPMSKYTNPSSKYFGDITSYDKDAGYIGFDENGNQITVPDKEEIVSAGSPRFVNDRLMTEAYLNATNAPGAVRFTSGQYPQYEPGGETRGREGTSAGKLIMKDRLTAPGMSLAGALMTGMNALSSWKEQPKFNENMYMPDAWHQVLKDSRTANPMSRGVNPVGPLRGMQIPDIKPLDEGRRWTNGSGNLLSGQTPYSGYSKMGGNTYEMGGDINDYYYNDIDTDMYQLGGTYELDQDEIDEIISNGGTVQYI